MVSRQNFQPEHMTVRELLTNSYNFYTIPEYQRPFKWNREKIERLIQDVKESIDTGEYFIGSFILIKKPEGFDVIDGQQRLTTLTLILDWPPNSGQDWLMTHADPSIMFSFHFSYTSLGVL